MRLAACPSQCVLNNLLSTVCFAVWAAGCGKCARKAPHLAGGAHAQRPEDPVVNHRIVQLGFVPQAEPPAGRSRTRAAPRRLVPIADRLPGRRRPFKCGGHQSLRRQVGKSRSRGPDLVDACRDLTGHRVAGGAQGGGHAPRPQAMRPLGPGPLTAPPAGGTHAGKHLAGADGGTARRKRRLAARRGRGRGLATALLRATRAPGPWPGRRRSALPAGPAGRPSASPPARGARNCGTALAGRTSPWARHPSSPTTVDGTPVLQVPEQVGHELQDGSEMVGVRRQ